MKKKKNTRVVACLVLSLLLVNLFQPLVTDAEEAMSMSNNYTEDRVERYMEYGEWLEKYQEVGELDAPIIAQPQGDSALRIGENKNACFNVVSDKKALCTVRIRYKAVVTEVQYASAINFTLSVNGEVPYREASQLVLPRIYEQVSREFESDSQGNHLQPAQLELEEEQSYIMSDSSGFHSESLMILLEEGKNEIVLSGTRGSADILMLEVLPIAELPSYEEYRTHYADVKCTNSEVDPIYREAEEIDRKSDITITAGTDRSTVGVTPNASDRMLLNVVDGGSFSTVGQVVCWDIDVPEDGFYSIGLHCVQNANVGAVSSRRLLIDGQVPFQEADSIVFAYSRKYTNTVLSVDDKPMEFYLTKGTHTIGLQVVLGPMAEYIYEVSDILESLNQDYMDILFYTGSEPDEYRDYGFETLIPDVLEDMSAQSDKLRNAIEGLRGISNGVGGNTTALERLADIVEGMVLDTDKIATDFSAYNSALSALGTWLNTYTAQPLQIDSFTLFAAGDEYAEKTGGFLRDLWFKVRIFLSTFLKQDTEEVGEELKTVNVWISTGRDQSKIIEKLCSEELEELGLKAEVKLVSADALLPNVLTGEKVDVYINATAADPINYAIRGAVLDLTQFDDYEEIADRFHEQSLVQFTYKDSVYALPESFDFPLMFYRTDIFSDLGLEPPQTWDDFYEIVQQLNKNNLSVGVLWSDMFNMRLFQSDGDYYNDSKTESILDNEKGLNAFSETVKLYTDYGLSVEFSFVNRFRNGDMPLGIVSYTTYNQLRLFAPEIDGMWEFMPVPGTQDTEGNVNHTTTGTGTGAVILRTTTDKEASWKFLKWWTSAETQTKYGLEMEKVVGVAARQTSANLEVVSNYPWTNREFEVLRAQWNTLKAIPQIPGSYYVQRTLDFTFNSVYSLGSEPIRTLRKNVEQLNDEIARKTAEFEK